MANDVEAPLRPSDLAAQKVLQGVTIESVWALLSACPVLILESGARLLEAGSRNHTLYMVLSGSLDVRLDEHQASDRGGSIETGCTVGEMSLIDTGPVPANVFATCRTRLLAVEEQVFWGLVEVSHDFAVNLLLLMTDRLRTSNNRMAEASVQRRVLERDAQVDGLTGLFNRRWLDQQGQRLVQRHAWAGDSFSLLMLDIDHFKRFNDEHGHATGDHVLVTVARTIQQCMRPTDLAARYGGEELVVLLPHTPLTGARIAAERLRAAIAAASTTMPNGKPLPPVTASIGVAELIADDSAAAMLTRADACLYEAKRLGRNRVGG